MNPMGVIDLQSKSPKILTILRPATVKVTIRGATAILKLSCGTWLLEDKCHPMTKLQKFLNFFGFYKERHFVRATRTS